MPFRLGTHLTGGFRKAHEHCRSLGTVAGRENTQNLFFLSQLLLISRFPFLPPHSGVMADAQHHPIRLLKMLAGAAVPVNTGLQVGMGAGVLNGQHHPIAGGCENRVPEQVRVTWYVHFGKFVAEKRHFQNRALDLKSLCPSHIASPPWKPGHFRQKRPLNSLFVLLWRDSRWRAIF